MKFNLTELVQFSPEQIASRSLTKNLAVTTPITLFAFSAGESISSEKSDLVKVILVLEGALTVQYANQLSEVATHNHLLVIPPLSVHQFSAEKNCRFLQIEIPTSKPKNY
ncbi:acetate kinase [Enterococcus camelliae]|uniref:Acetate kinase n=1 Tax=Enterococcus camelliae TaxID=453959 RepID=A0ABW5TM46_9ENTE